MNDPAAPFVREIVEVGEGMVQWEGKLMAYKRKVATIVEGGKMKGNQGNRNGNTHKWSAERRANFEAAIAARRAKRLAKVAKKGTALQLTVSNGGVATSYFQHVEAAATALKVSPRDLALAIIDVAYPS